ncbi:Nucleotidyl transferase AbiEii toxin, Type IV TA system [Thalassospira xiamenensis M-5 = DSM 17429]|uniref:Nucleotidyl transferase AbiEii/AbiGii toxin family protein n=1 Tax=Thalassospira xiamenensis M-5 = DSM 17429 TaxID=1123366 RepID=A0AB72UJK0_9PROT|nr:nucleotidyl transferase AbiEii/AbiGii toxin family protein [Thalassospira xiamenensis]AJD54304.1 hypothetical protein TH3_21158 [Thalassospira xiamenensis M-5 = DSM 17429]SIT20992.1 Nucleotidyl transferase AbiEii toxin, Type IV TA system [Thalassospira xiamenensis M-5 = DSM 17429]
MHFSNAETRQLASAVQDIMLSHFGQSSKLIQGNIVFHGGTALKFVHGSSRFSEDLDFLLNRQAFGDEAGSLPETINDIMDKGLTKLSEELLDRPGLDIDFAVNLHLKTGNRSWEPGHPGKYSIELSSPNRRGKIRTVCEFWPTNPEYLANYESLQQAVPDNANAAVSCHDLIQTVEGRMYQDLPVASIEAILADKFVALANRDYLKWRDVYDVWYVMERMTPAPQIDGKFVERFQHHLTAYSGEGIQNPESKLIAVAERIESASIEEIGRGLSTFFTTMEWNSIAEDSAQRIKSSASTACNRLAQELRLLSVESDRKLDATPE